MPVDYETIQKIQKLGDDVLIGVSEVAALTGVQRAYGPSA